MSKTRLIIPLNDYVLRTLWAGVEVSCEPPEVHTHRLLVLLICRNIGGLNVDSFSDRVPSLGRRHRPTNRSVVDGKTKDHGDVLQHHCGHATRKVQHVGLWMPLVHKCHQRGGVHHRKTVGDEPSKRQEHRMPYERLIPLVPHQGVVRADPERVQTLWNTTIV
jgi:hypothetical protein